MSSKASGLVTQLKQLGALYHGLGQTFKGQAFQRLAALVDEKGIDGALKYLPSTSKASIALIDEFRRTGRIRRLAEAKKGYHGVEDARKAPRRSSKKTPTAKPRSSSSLSAKKPAPRSSSSKKPAPRSSSSAKKPAPHRSSSSAKKPTPRRSSSKKKAACAGRLCAGMTNFGVQCTNTVRDQKYCNHHR